MKVRIVCKNRLNQFCLSLHCNLGHPTCISFHRFLHFDSFIFFDHFITAVLLHSHVASFDSSTALYHDHSKKVFSFFLGNESVYHMTSILAFPLSILLHLQILQIPSDKCSMQLHVVSYGPIISCKKFLSS